MAAKGSASETFPDLHHKMSKKIAQLTKVIYHLNTRNEDHQADVDALNANHQVEVQAILKDAAAKLARFKDAIESRQQQVNEAAKFEKLQKKHQLEKQQAFEEFSRFKENTIQEAKQTADKYKLKVEAFKTEIEDMNSKFQDKITAFEAANKQLKSALDEAMKSGSVGMEGMKRAHEKEIEQLIQSNNEKYQAMVVSHLKEMESLDVEMERKIKEAKDSTRKEMAAETEQKLGQLRAQLEGDRQTALMVQSREYDDKMKAQRDEAGAKLESALSELQSKAAEASKLRTELEAMKKEMDSKLRELEKTLAAQSGSADQQVQGLKDIIASKERDIAALQAVADERIQEIAQLKDAEVDHNRMVEKHVQIISQQKTDISDLMNQLSIAGNATEANEAALRAKIGVLERDVLSMTEDISKNGKLLLSTRDDLKRSEANAKSAAADALAKIDGLKKEVESLQQRLRDALAQSKNSEEGLGKELDALKRILTENEDKYRANVADMTSTHNKNIDSMKSSHERALSDLQNSLNEAIQQRAAADAASEQAIQNMKVENEEKIAQICAANKKTLDEVTSEHETEVASLKATIEALEQQLLDVSSSADGEKGVLKTQLEKLEGKNKSLQRELDAKKKDGERVDSVVTGLKNQVESLREELKASQAAYREKMESSLAKLDADWQSKMDALIAEHTAALLAAEQTADARLQEQLSALQAEHEKEVAALKSALKKEASDASEELVKAEHERLRLEEELTMAKKAHEVAIQDLLLRHKGELADAEARRKKEINALQSELSSSAESALANLKQQHSNDMAELQSRMDKALADLTARHGADMEASKALSANALKTGLSELEAKMNAEKTTALATSAARHANELANFQQERDISISKLKDKISELEKSLYLSQGDVKSMQDQIESNQRERALREEQVVLERDSMQHDFNNDLRKEKERGQRALADAAERNAQEVKEVRQQGVVERAQLEVVIEGLKADLKALSAKYKSRESRQEDLAEIARLQEEMVEKDRLVVQTREEMMYFKREMLNREESYNDKFNRQPNVGVMNVIKNKNPTSEKSGMGGGGPGGKKAAAPQFRPLNPSQAGGSIPGVGMGGVGGMAMSGSAPMATGSAKR